MSPSADEPVQSGRGRQWASSPTSHALPRFAAERVDVYRVTRSRSDVASAATAVADVRRPSRKPSVAHAFAAPGEWLCAHATFFILPLRFPSLLPNIGTGEIRILLAKQRWGFASENGSEHPHVVHVVLYSSALSLLKGGKQDDMGRTWWIFDFLCSG